MRILVVDDNMDTAEAMALLLRTMGHEVMFAVTGDAAIGVSRSFRPETVFLDLGLPDAHGSEIAQRMRREAGAAQMRIIAVTGSARADDRDQAIKAGCDDYVIKPLDPAFIASLLGHRRV